MSITPQEERMLARCLSQNRTAYTGPYPTTRMAVAMGRQTPDRLRHLETRNRDVIADTVVRLLGHDIARVRRWVEANRDAAFRTDMAGRIDLLMTTRKTEGKAA